MDESKSYRWLKACGKVVPMTDAAAPSLDSLLREVADQLAAAGIEQARIDAEVMLAHVLGESRGRLQALAIMGKRPAPEQVARLRAMADERADRVPLQHLTGRAPFRRIELSVGPGVFVPRPETETVVDCALAELERTLALPERAGTEAPIVVDFCTGSGTIALAIANEVPDAQVWAVEKSVEAHAWATRNVAEWGDGRVTLVQGDVSALDPEIFEPLMGRVDLLVSNPPYVPSGMIPKDPEVRDHDPELALYSGEDGLDLIRVIARIGRGLVHDGGSLVLEHAEHQGEAIRAILTAAGWHDAATHEDLTGRDRTTLARR